RSRRDFQDRSAGIATIAPSPHPPCPSACRDDRISPVPPHPWTRREWRWPYPYARYRRGGRFVSWLRQSASVFQRITNLCEQIAEISVAAQEALITHLRRGIDALIASA